MANDTILSPEYDGPDADRTYDLQDIRVDPDGNTFLNSDDDDCTVLREVSA